MYEYKIEQTQTRDFIKFTIESVELFNSIEKIEAINREEHLS